MDLDRLQRNLSAEFKALYFSRYPEKGVEVEVEGFDVRLARMKTTRRLLIEHARWRKRRDEAMRFRADVAARIDEAKRLLDAGKRFMSFDIERGASQGINELGVCLYKRGEFTGFNWIRDGAKRREPFLFGESQRASPAHMYFRLQEETIGVAAYVGHDLVSDFEHLRSHGAALPRKPIFDTSHLSRVLNDEHPTWLRGELFNLGGLCARFGIEAHATHCGGNDARYAMEAFLRLCAL